MKNKAIVRKAGLVGMFGAVLWAIVNVLEVSFDLYPPDGSGALYITNQVLALVALAAIAFGYLGIIWGGGVNGRLGKTGVWLFVVGNGLIIVGGIMALVVSSDDSPLFLVFPIGALLMDVGAILTGIAVARDKQWQGWQRWMPLIYAMMLMAIIEIPFMMGLYDDRGPVGMVEVVQDIGLFFVGLAVYTAKVKETAVFQSPFRTTA